MKVGTDKDASAIDTIHIIPTTIKRLVSFHKPNKLPPNSRVNDTEKTVWEIKANITEYKSEADGDFHVVVKDSAGDHMIIEFPDSACLKGSRLAISANSARKHFQSKFHKTPTGKMKVLKTPIFATIIGVGFYDKNHRQAGVAINGIELHPVLKVCFEGESCK